MRRDLRDHGGRVALHCATGENVQWHASDVLFVRAFAPHRFIGFSNDRSTWVSIDGPNGDTRDIPTPYHPRLTPHSSQSPTLSIPDERRTAALPAIAMRASRGASPDRSTGCDTNSITGPKSRAAANTCGSRSKRPTPTTSTSRAKRAAAWACPR
ncbi:hypothetical protein BVIET440_30049 [Burkholderia vietnamiensis]